jgi:hypothetical protein
VGMFDEIAIINYRSSFADQGKQAFIFRFCLQQTNRSLPFVLRLQQINGSGHFPLVPFSVNIYLYGKQNYILIHIYCRFIWKIEAQEIFLNQFAVFVLHANRSFRLSLCVDEETIGSYPFSKELNILNGLNRRNRLAIYAKNTSRHVNFKSHGMLYYSVNTCCTHTFAEKKCCRMEGNLPKIKREVKTP